MKAENEPITSLTVNGSPKEERRLYYWSPIEVYITQPGYSANGNNKSLIDFLKEDTNELVFTER